MPGGAGSEHIHGTFQEAGARIKVTALHHFGGHVQVIDEDRVVGLEGREDRVEERVFQGHGVTLLRGVDEVSEGEADAAEEAVQLAEDGAAAAPGRSHQMEDVAGGQRRPEAVERRLLGGTESDGFGHDNLGGKGDGDS